MVSVVALHFALAAAILILRQRIGRRALALGAVGPLAVLGYAAAISGPVLDGIPVAGRVRWVPALDLEIDFRVDAYALLFLFVIGVAGTAIFLYAARYFADSVEVATFGATMTAFGGAMVGLVASDHLLSVFLFWELTTITSYLLIGYADKTAEARSAALHAALVTAGGGLAMLGGLVVLASDTGAWTISGMLAAPPAPSGPVGLAWALVLAGAATKSAQFPFHGWLPGAMAAPTPASAFLHSATMVKAGVFLVGRLAPAATASTAWWSTAVLALGFATMVVGGWRALRQDDLKLLLAFGTVSQLGFLFLLAGVGDPKILFGGLALLAGHALFKATLFMVVGTIDHETGTRDLRRLDGLRTAMPAVFWTALAAAASMAALPFTFGFAAKEAAFDGLLTRHPLLVAAAATTSVLTAVYTGRFLVGAFGPAYPGHEPVGGHAHSPRDALVVAPAVLAATGIGLGLVPGLARPLVDAATASVTGIAGAGKLVVWPGLVPALGWSLASLALGAVLVWRARAVDRLTDAVHRAANRLPTADGSFSRAVAGTIRFADRSSSTLQSGSLPAYLTIITLTAVLLPASALVGRIDRPPLPAVGGVIPAVLGVLVVAAAVTLLFARHRFAAVMLLGGVGYGVAGLYAALGGPDLALAQLLIETLAVALFAFVLRRLPPRYEPAPGGHMFKAVVAVAVGLFVGIGALVTTGARQGVPVATTFIADSIPEANGANVVNVIIVDFRAMDTLGEITVLALATLGVVTLVRPLLRRPEPEGGE
jgi:multicomponent Na+:H+ antiporter subunit A